SVISAYRGTARAMSESYDATIPPKYPDAVAAMDCDVMPNRMPVRTSIDEAASDRRSRMFRFAFRLAFDRRDLEGGLAIRAVRQPLLAFNALDEHRFGVDEQVEFRRGRFAEAVAALERQLHQFPVVHGDRLRGSGGEALIDAGPEILQRLIREAHDHVRREP